MKMVSGRCLALIGSAAGLAAVLGIIALIVLSWHQKTKTKTMTATAAVGRRGGRGGGGGKLDPVNDPAYNAEQVIKHSLLLEEHLVHVRKRCTGCISKHFLMLMALSEEAQCLAGPDIASYPWLDDGPDFYRILFEGWLADRKTDGHLRRIGDRLRARRRDLIKTYILGATKTSSSSSSTAAACG